MSAYCTSRAHAIDAAKFLIRMRRIPTHTITFKTTHDGLTAGLAPGDYIKVAMDETEYDEFNNGVVTPEGALVSTKPLSDGTHNVVAWDGTEGTPPADATLTVSDNGKTATPTGIVFTVKLPSTQVRVYQVERITPDDEGTFTIEAMHMPVNSSGILEVADGFDTAGNWTIQD
jgi:Phage-related protein, tail component